MTMEIRQASNGDFDISNHEDTSFGVIIQSLNQFYWFLNVAELETNEIIKIA